MADEPYDAGSRQHVKLAAKAAKQADATRKDVIVGIMSVANGRQWMLELLERCHCFASSFDRNALSMAFTEGERNIGLQLLADVMAFCPETYVTMVQERNVRDTAATIRRNAAPDPDRNPGGSESDAVGDGDSEA